MNLEEKAKEYSFYNCKGWTQNRGIIEAAFMAGYRNCKFNLKDFLTANPKATHQAIIEYMEGLV